MNKNDIETDSSESGKEDLTDEFPVLDVDAIATDAVSAETADSAGKVTVASLNRLEDDIHSLQMHWSTIEGDLNKRDAEITELNSELSIRQSAMKSMDGELTRNQEEIAHLSSRLDEAASRYQELQTAGAEREDLAEERKAEIRAKQAEMDGIIGDRDRIKNEVSALREQLKEQNAETADATALAEILEEVANGLRVKIQDLDAYVDRRKADWQKMQDDLAAFRDTLLGMGKKVAEKDAIVSRLEGENISLSEALLDLEQQCAELDGRRAERETANGELQEKLLVASQDVDRLNHERQRISDERDQKVSALADEHEARMESLTAAHGSAAEALKKELAAQEHRIESKSAEFDQERRRAESALSDVSRIETDLAAAQERVTGLEFDITAQRDENQALQVRFDEHEQEALGLWEDFKTARDRLTEVDAQLLDRDARVGELETAAGEQADRLAAATCELTAKAEQLLELETELRAQTKATELLDRNAQRLSDLGSYVKALDAQISQQSEEHDDERPGMSRSSERATPFIIGSKGDQSFKFPLFKEKMTIGRSVDADIQLCWKYISREHAKIVSDGNATTIEDLGSKNGIFVNDEPVKRKILHDGDRLEIGELRFRFVDGLH